MPTTTITPGAGSLGIAGGLPITPPSPGVYGMRITGLAPLLTAGYSKAYLEPGAQGITRLASSSPPRDAFSITTTDTLDELPTVVRAIYIGGTGSGNLKVRTFSGNDVAYTGLVAGMTVVGAFRKVWKTGTDVTNLIGHI